MHTDKQVKVVVMAEGISLIAKVGPEVVEGQVYYTPLHSPFMIFTDHGRGTTVLVPYPAGVPVKQFDIRSDKLSGRPIPADHLPKELVMRYESMTSPIETPQQGLVLPKGVM